MKLTIWLPFALAILISGPLAGCVTKGQAAAQARAAFLAGQEQARQEIRQKNQHPTITFMGPTQTPMVAWTPGMTLAQGILAAGYTGSGDPKEILILRDGRAIRVDATQLLNGQDVPLEAGDLVQLR